MTHRKMYKNPSDGRNSIDFFYQQDHGFGLRSGRDRVCAGGDCWLLDPLVLADALGQDQVGEICTPLCKNKVGLGWYKEDLKSNGKIGLQPSQVDYTSPFPRLEGDW